MRILQAIPATPEPYDLAEGPVWDPCGGVCSGSTSGGGSC
jgi:hypothetical protein